MKYFIHLQHADKKTQKLLEKLTKGAKVGYVADKGVQLELTSSHVSAIRSAGLMWLCDEEQEG